MESVLGSLSIARPQSWILGRWRNALPPLRHSQSPVGLGLLLLIEVRFVGLSMVGGCVMLSARAVVEHTINNVTLR